jgi:hypothetical protein
MAAVASHLEKGGKNRFNIVTQDIQTEQAATVIPIFLISLCFSHLHILISVDETFDHLPVTDELEAFRLARETFEAKLMQIVIKHRGASIAQRMQDEEWLKTALDPER